METPDLPSTQIPDLKLNGGKGRERRRGGAGWLGGQGAGSAFTGGSELLGMGLAKTLLSLAVVAGVAAGSWQAGRAFGGRAAVKPAAQAAPSERVAPRANDASKPAGTVVPAPGSQAGVSGGAAGEPAGTTPAAPSGESASPSGAPAPQAAAAPAAAEASNRKPAAARDAAPAGRAAAPTAGASFKKALSGGNSNQFGSGLGSRGGSSGASAAAGGAGFAAGAGAAAHGTRPGSLSAFRSAAAPRTARGARAASGKSRAKGFAKRQLDAAFGQSRSALSASSSENAAASAASAFDNNPGQATVIAGPGVGQGGRPMSVADGGAAINPNSGGGPIAGAADSGGAACPSGTAPDINGNCQTIQVTVAKGAADYQWMVDAVKGLMAVLALISLYLLYLQYVAIPAAVAAAATTGGLASPAVQALITQARALHYIVTGIGIAIAALGVMIMAASGDKVMGGIITAIGVFVAGAVNTGFFGIGASSLAQVAAGGLIVSAGGAMAAANVKRPAAMD